MKSMLRTLLESAGIYYGKRQYMPCGLDWLWDIQRVAANQQILTVFDVGANVGQTTIAVKSRFPGATVHAFEPVARTFAELQANVAGLSGVTCHRLALSDVAGQAVMAVAANSLTNHLVEVPAAVTTSATMESVDVDTVDAFCRQRDIERLDILKVDAEGADLKVLKGADRMLRENRVAFVFAEVGFKPSDAGHVYLAHVLEQLNGTGLVPYSFYDYCRLTPPAYEQEGLGLVFSNVLFVNPAAIASM